MMDFYHFIFIADTRATQELHMLTNLVLLLFEYSIIPLVPDAQ